MSGNVRGRRRNGNEDARRYQCSAITARTGAHDVNYNAKKRGSE